jgi:hypothetical protein
MGGAVWLGLILMTGCGGSTRGHLPGPNTSSGGSESAGMAGDGAAGEAAGPAGSGVGGRAPFDRNHVPCQATSDCPMGATCETGHCNCPASLPDACSGNARDPSAEVKDWVCTSLRVDASNCGACGNACEESAACTTGACSESAQVVSAVTGCVGKFEDHADVRLAVSDNQLFWTDSMAGSVQALGLPDGEAVPLATAELNPRWLVVDAAGVYWTTEGNAAGGAPSIMKRTLPLRAPDVSITLLSLEPGSQIEGLAVQGGTLYYALGHDVYALSTDEATPGNVVVGTAGGLPRGLALTDTRVIWTTEERGAIGSDDLAAGSNDYLELAAGQNNVVWPDLAASGSYAYWADGQRLMRSSVKGDTTAERIAQAASAVTALVVGDRNAYFADDSGGISRHGLSPGDEPATPLALAQFDVTALALGDGMIYWESECEIRRAAF